MIDIHTHILPGIDDGVVTEDESVEFARVAHADGVRLIVATPHCKEGFYDNDRPKILAAVARLRARLAAESIGIDVLPGAEVHLCPDLVERIRDGRATTLADNGKTLLLELSLSQYPVELNNLIFQLKLSGIQVVLAHPERIRFFQDDIRRYEEVVRLGAYGQITTGSVLGVFGSTALSFSEELLKKDLIHVLSSDAHNCRGRPPVLSEAVEAMIPWVGEERARSMANDVPLAFVEGREPTILPLDRPARKHASFLSRWFARDR